MYRVSQLFSKPTLIYIAVSPLLFALVHWEGGTANVIAAYIFGLGAVGVFMYMKNIWPLIIGHIYTDYVWFS